MKSYSIYSRLVSSLLSLSRPSKNLLVMITDYIALVLAFWSSLSIRSNAIYIPTSDSNFLILLGPLIAIPIFYVFGLYRSLIRYSNYQSLLTIMLAVSVYTILWFLIVLSVGLVEKPYDFLIINWLITVFFSGGIRYMARWFFTTTAKRETKIVIYGAGSSGVQLESAMQHNPEIKVIAFLDDDPKIQGSYIEGIKIQKPSSLSRLIERNGVTEVLVAIPSISRLQTQKILQSLKLYPVVIRTLPSLTDLAKGRVSVSDLKKVKIEDLLRREIRQPNKQLLKHNIEQKNVLVTGAGGSIGSELSRQIIRNKPKLLILYDISELALYTIERELLGINHGIRVIPILGDITESSRLGKLIRQFEIQTIYHSAAYKHVPMVEKNIIAGIRTNIYGTLSSIEAAIDGNVESFVFISTDKAVRPTNIMGATKRFAELILQAILKRQSKGKINNKTQISIVRFGNVLDSSGSVVPLFRQQLKEGGPLTVTDPDIIRYFMTITEAAQLVIQAGAMKSRGDIFVLDMGEQMLVVDLAKDMIRLSGMTVKDERNPDGDVEIIFTGLRPGEKLYEELLIGNNVRATEHKKIMRAIEEDIEWEDLQQYLATLKHATETDDYNKIREIFLNTISGFNPDT